MSTLDSDVPMLRHTLATLAYRAGKAPPEIRGRKDPKALEVLRVRRVRKASRSQAAASLAL